MNLKAKVTVKKMWDKWHCHLQIGVQGFMIHSAGGGKTFAKWQARMLRKALKKLESKRRVK